MTRESADRYADFFRHLSPADVDRLGVYLVDDVRFRDPFNDVRGIDAVTRIFRRMFETCTQVRFDIDEVVTEGHIAWLHWQMTFMPRHRLLGREPWLIDGVSRVRFAGDGRVVEHLDYWDAGEYFYQRLPLLGALIRWVRRRV
ncbi:MAG: nuclear transport factor 2 family protein [Gammaproteobacteria bacterium]|jgi:hypothetical protein